MLKVAFVVGEHSSDRLGAALIRALRRCQSEEVVPVGLGGDAMATEGLRSIFDIDELSIIGVGAVIARLPKLVGRLRQTVRTIVGEAPDLLVVIDSYAFSHRVARRVRARLPHLPIVNYVPPAVWAYHGGRAAVMRSYIDRVVSVFPFEPAVYKELGGPAATYVGHPLMAEPGLRAILAERDGRGVPKPVGNPPTLLILPGSRSGEVARLIADFGRTLDLLRDRMPAIRAVLPAVPRLEPMIREKVRDWRTPPEIVVGEDAKWRAFAQADAALAASGTVALELALADVPMTVCYKLDPVTYRLRHAITAWTASLPNYIVDHPLVPEFFHDDVRPAQLARRLQRLLTASPEREAQLAGFATIRDRMAFDAGDPGDRAAEIVVEELKRRGRLAPQPRSASGL